MSSSSSHSNYTHAAAAGGTRSGSAPSSSAGYTAILPDDEGDNIPEYTTIPRRGHQTIEYSTSPVLSQHPPATLMSSISRATRILTQRPSATSALNETTPLLSAYHATFPATSNTVANANLNASNDPTSDLTNPSITPPLLNPEELPPYTDFDEENPISELPSYADVAPPEPSDDEWLEIWGGWIVFLFFIVLIIWTALLASLPLWAFPPSLASNEVK
ncbi:hypothetical protein HDU76_013458 [Blyttiomyces sp. JEL0837]|nr:hypothetical protein HDU76_013458 [Blyttiomyces sp. JEL0837]